MIYLVLLINLDRVDTDDLGKQRVRVLAEVLMILGKDRHEEVLLLLLDLFNEEAFVVSLDQRHAALSRGLFEGLGKSSRVVEGEKTLAEHVLAHFLTQPQVLKD